MEERSRRQAKEDEEFYRAYQARLKEASYGRFSRSRSKWVDELVTTEEEDEGEKGEEKEEKTSAPKEGEEEEKEANASAPKDDEEDERGENTIAPKEGEEEENEEKTSAPKEGEEEDEVKDYDACPPKDRAPLGLVSLIEQGGKQICQITVNDDWPLEKAKAIMIAVAEKYARGGRGSGRSHAPFRPQSCFPILLDPLSPT